MAADAAAVLTNIVSFMTDSGVAVYVAAGLVVGLLGRLIITARKASK